MSPERYRCTAVCTNVIRPWPLFRLRSPHSYESATACGPTERDAQVSISRLELTRAKTRRTTTIGANELELAAILRFNGGLQRLRSSGEKLTDAGVANRAALENERLRTQTTVNGPEEHGQPETVRTTPANSTDPTGA
jgi:hypothetical protein